MNQVIIPSHWLWLWLAHLPTSVWLWPILPDITSPQGCKRYGMAKCPYMSRSRWIYGQKAHLPASVWLWPILPDITLPQGHKRKGFPSHGQMSICEPNVHIWAEVDKSMAKSMVIRLALAKNTISSNHRIRNIWLWTRHIWL